MMMAMYLLTTINLIEHPRCTSTQNECAAVNLFARSSSTLQLNKGIAAADCKSYY